MASFANNQRLLDEAMNPRVNSAAFSAQGPFDKPTKYCNYYNTSGCRYGCKCWFVHKSNPNSINQVLLNQMNGIQDAILKSNALIKQLYDNQVQITQLLNQKTDNILSTINLEHNNLNKSINKNNEEIHNKMKATMNISEENIIKNVMEQIKTYTTSQMNNLRIDFSLIHDQLMNSVNNMLQYSWIPEIEVKSLEIKPTKISKKIDLQCESNTTILNIESKNESKLDEQNKKIIDDKKLNIDNAESITLSQYDCNTAVLNYQPKEEIKLDIQATNSNS